jgi:hypothetical protein
MGTFFTSQFVGGMNEVLSPSLLERDTAAYLANADVENGKIKAAKTPLLLPQTSPSSFGHYGNQNRSVVKWYNRTYWSNNNAKSEPFYGGREENYLGIPFPDYKKEVLIEKEDGDFLGTYKYCITYVNKNGWESAPGSINKYEKIVSFDNEKAKITVTWSDTKVSYAKIYRTQKEGADFYCVGEIKNPGDSLVDNVDDYSLVGLQPLDSYDNYPPPSGGKYLCESGGVFFLAIGSTLHFSVVGNPHAWPPLNFIGFDDTITGITAEFQGILVFTANNAYRIVGAESTETVSKTLIPGNQGCVKYNSIAKISNAPVWLSNDGICMWNGESINIISNRKINTSRLQVTCAVSANDRYYLFLSAGAIVFDHRNGDIFYRLTFTCSYSWYDAEKDIMYLKTGNQIYQYGVGNEAQYYYVSPAIGVPESEYNYFKEVVVSVDGNAAISSSVDGKTVFSVNVIGGKHRIKFPYNTVGRYAQITVSGNSALNELAVVYS